MANELVEPRTASLALEPLAESGTPTKPPPSFINLLYEFAEKWNHQATGNDYFVKLQAFLDQAPPNIITEIAPKDTMFAPQWREHYLSVGPGALRCIKLAMMAAGQTAIRKILDLPCGHGRVMRTLRAAFPDADIWACDLDRDGVDFCARTFGAVPVYSAERPDDIPIRESFDLIWCGSLLTHLDRDVWPGFLRFFAAHLAPGGLLVCSVHGRESVHWLRSGKFDYHLADVPAILAQYDRDGFGYQAYTAHEHRNYGISIASPAWVMQRILEQPNLRLVNYTETGLDNHHDVVSCVRMAS
jgi:SAM-dependent methyltransferase